MNCRRREPKNGTVYGTYTSSSSEAIFFLFLPVSSGFRFLFLAVLPFVVVVVATHLCLAVSLPLTVYLPKGMDGRIRCPEEANPPHAVIIWKKSDRIIDSTDRVVIDGRGTLVIEAVASFDAGHYTCTPYSPLSDVYNSFSIHVVVKDLPTFLVRPIPVYQRKVGQMVVMPCVAEGDPKPVISWKKVEGSFPPTTKTLQDGGNLTIVDLTDQEHGTYECIARNVVTSIIATTLLIVQTTVRSSPYDIRADVTDSTVRLSWFPPYVDEGERYNYELWCQTLDDGSSNDDDDDVNVNWQRFDAIPDNVTTVTVYNLRPKTRYRFKILSNHSGRLHFSRAIDVRTKAKDMPSIFVVIPEDPDDEDMNSGDNSGSTPLPDRTIKPSPGHHPTPPYNVTVQQQRNGVNISWMTSKRSSVPVDHFVVEYRTVGQWVALPDRISGQTTHYLWTVASLGATYQFRVVSHGSRGSASRPSSIVTFVTIDPMSAKVQTSGASVGGIVGGTLLVVALLAVAYVTVKVYKLYAKRKRETSSVQSAHATNSISRTLEGRASPILESLSIISNHSQTRNNSDNDIGQIIHETPI